MNNSAKAFKSGIWYTVGNFIAKAAAFITVPIFTRILSVEDIGKFSNYTSWLGILMIITTFELWSSINIARFDFKNDINDYIASNLLQGSLITSLCFLIFFAFFDFFSNIFSLSLFEMLLLYIYCLTCPALQMYQLKCRIDYQYKMSVFLSLLSVFSSTIFSLLFVITWADKYCARCVGYTIPIIVINIGIYVVLMKRANKINIKSYWRYALYISFPLIWHTLAGNILTSSDRVMINYYQGSHSLALYSIAYSCASIVQLLWISMNSAWTPWALEMIDQKRYKQLNMALRPYSIFFGIIVFGFLLIAPEALLLMGGKAYGSALSVIPPVMISYVFNFSYSFYVVIEQYEKKQVTIAGSTIFAAIINIGLNSVLIPKYGYTIAAYTTLIGYMILFLMHFLACVKMRKISVVDNKFVFRFLAVFLIILILMPLLYRNTVIRYGLIGIIFVVSVAFVVIFRKELTYLIKNKSMEKFRNRLANIRVKRHG